MQSRQFSGILCGTIRELAYASTNRVRHKAGSGETDQTKKSDLHRLSHLCISYENITTETNDAAESEEG